MFDIKPSPKIRGFKIGPVEIANPLILAPLAGITDTVFRRMIKSMGAGLLYSDMISCQALHYNNKKTVRMLDFTPDELPLAVQIFGTNPPLMADAAKRVEAEGASIVDINLGCSVPKVAKAGAGAALCRDLPLLSQILEAITAAVSIPVTIKIRKGWSSQEISAFDVARIARECGVAAIALHGRTSTQKYGGHADWEFIREFREKVADLPVIGNGDIKTPEMAVERLGYSGCDGIMIGREAFYHPWIFKDTLTLLQGNPRPESPPLSEIKALILHHLDGMVERYGEERGVPKMRKFGACYTRGLPDSARFRENFFRMKKYDEMKNLVDEYFEMVETWVKRRMADGMAVPDNVAETFRVPDMKC